MALRLLLHETRTFTGATESRAPSNRSIHFQPTVVAPCTLGLTVARPVDALSVSYHSLPFAKIPDEARCGVLVTVTRVVTVAGSRATERSSSIIKGYLSCLRIAGSSRWLHSERQLFVLFDHLFGISFSLDGLLKLKLSVSHLFIFLLDNVRQVGPKIFISFHISWLAANDTLHFFLELLYHIVLVGQLESEVSDLGCGPNK